MEKENKKTEKKKEDRITVLAFFLVAAVFLLITGVVTGTMTSYVEQGNPMEWSLNEGISHKHCEELIMMPGMAPYIEKVYERGIRDPEFKIETGEYESLEALYSILPFASEEERGSIVYEELTKVEDIPDKLKNEEEMDEIWYAESLPLTEEGDDGKKVASFYNFHENYIIKGPGGYRFVFIVQTI